jgi:transcriptional regulator with XRE-family HTH domain
VTIDLPDDLGGRIRTLRAAQRMTQKQLARACKVAQSTVAQIESGRKLPSLPTLSALAHELGTDAGAIIAGCNF